VLDPVSEALAAFGIFAGATVSGFTGFAFSAVAGAVLLHVLPPIEAVPLMMICSVLVQGACLISLRRQIQWRGSVMLVAGGLLGLPPALYLLLHANATLFRAGFGVFLAGYAAYMLLRPACRYFHDVQGALHDAAIGLIGLAGGLIGGLTAMPGALPTIWCDLRGLAKDQQRGLVQPYITAMQIAALGFLASQHRLPTAIMGDLLFSAAPLAAGTLFGLTPFGKWTIVCSAGFFSSCF
jgi:uncharacterized membrane protein YfcA